MSTLKRIAKNIIGRTNYRIVHKESPIFKAGGGAAKKATRQASLPGTEPAHRPAVQGNSVSSGPYPFKVIEYGKSDLKVAIDPDVVSEKVIRYIRNGWYESREIQELSKLVREGDTVVELGSGVGLISSAAWKTGMISVMHCFEADPRLIGLVKETHRLNGVGNAQVHNCAISPKPADLDRGSILFHLREDFWGSSIDSTTGRSVKANVEVPVRSLDDILGEYRPTLLIIDIEGAEDGLFEGADLSSVDRVSIEIHPAILKGAGVRRLFDDLHAAGLVYDAKHSAYRVCVFSRSD